MTANITQRIAFRVDASQRIGGGHALRCLTLADQLSMMGQRCHFVAAELSPWIAERITLAGHDLSMIGQHDLPEAVAGWDRQAYDIATQAADAARTRSAIAWWEPDWIVVDHYRLDAAWEAAATWAGQVMVIDDLANRPHRCDLLLDQTTGRSASDYAELAPGAGILTDGLHALLRPEFAAARPGALLRRRNVAPGGRILVSLGSTDIDGLSATVLEQLLAAGAGAVDMVLTSTAPSLPACQVLARAHRDVRLHVDMTELAPLLTEADVAIGAAGGSSWERCCLGLPTVMLIIADNQRTVAANLQEASAALYAESAGSAAIMAIELLQNGKRCARMAAAAFAIVDGLGASRVSERIGAQRTGMPAPRSPVAVRRAVAEDSETIWLWRNDPLTRQMARDRQAIAWPDHARWYGHVVRDGRTTMLMAERDGVPVGMVRFDALEAEMLVSINVDPARRGEGVGSAALVAALRTQPAGRRIRADVRIENVVSQRLFAGVGFVDDGPADEGMRVFRMTT